MLYLIFSIMSSVSIAHIMKIIGLRKIPLWNTIAINYLFAVSISLYYTPLSNLQQPLGSLAIGVFLGALFLGTFFLFAKSVNRLGVSISVSLMRLSAVIPTMGSIVFFSEDPATRQIAGIIIAFMALPYSAMEKPGANTIRQFRKNGLLLGMALFFAFGINDMGLKFETGLYPQVDNTTFLTIIFSVAFIFSVTVALIRREYLNFRTILTGLALGLVNYLSTLFFLLALRSLPGMVVYPVNGIGIILLTAISGFFLWKEKPATHNYIFFAMAILALLLIY